MISKNKRGWIRIVEAFVSVLLILGVLLTIMARQRVNSVAQENEVILIQQNILDNIVLNEELRGDILSGKLEGVNEHIKDFVPAGMSFYTRLCNYNDVCGLDVPVYSRVFAREVLVVANLTYYNSSAPKKLKIFFWEGPWPKETCLMNPVCTALDQKTCAGPKIRIGDKDYDTAYKSCINDSINGGRGCFVWSDPVMCETDLICEAGACKQAPEDTERAVLLSTFTHGEVFIEYDPEDHTTYNKIDFILTIKETAGVDWFVDSFEECWSIKPSGWDYNCKQNSAINIITKFGSKTLNRFARTPDVGNNIYNLSLKGHDANGNQVNTETFTIQFP
jgi:hypothetical protein